MSEDSEVNQDVSLTVDDGLSSEKTGQGDGVDDVDDLLEGGEGETKSEPEKKDPQDKGGGNDVEAQLKELQTWKEATESNLRKLEQDKKNLQKALHSERQAKKGASQKTEETVLTDEQLETIIRENPDDPKILLRVTRYMAEKIAGGMKDTAISEVDVSRKSKAVNSLLLERYPALAEEGSEMRIEVDQVKEAYGLEGNPFGDAFAVGVKVVEQLPTLLTNAFEAGKKAALGQAAEKKRGEKINDTKLTPPGKGKSSASSELSKEYAESAQRLNLGPTAMKHYRQLVGKQPRTVSVEE